MNDSIESGDNSVIGDDPEDGVLGDESFDFYMGMYRSQIEALGAARLGEIELWLKAITPKSMEDWKDFELVYGKVSSLNKRWIKSYRDSEKG